MNRFLYIIFLLFTASGLFAADELRVGISPFEPFVFCPSAAAPSGFSIDLWETLASRHSRNYKYVICSGVKDKLSRLQAGELDVAIGGISITADREKMIDFTHAFIHTGLGILVPAEQHSSIWRGMSLVLTRGKIMIIISFLLLIIVAGHLMWMAEHGKEMFSDKYFPGVLEGIYWAIVTASTVGYGDKAPVKWSGRILAGLVIVISLPMFALFTAELASSITVQNVQSMIQGPEDLANRRVGVVTGSTSADKMLEYRCRTKNYQQIKTAIKDLEAGLLDAIVYDAPILQHIALHNPQVTVAEKLFAPQEIAIAVAAGSGMRETLNTSLLTLIESGQMNQMQAKWLGNQ